MASCWLAGSAGTALGVGHGTAYGSNYLTYVHSQLYVFYYSTPCSGSRSYTSAYSIFAVQAKFDTTGLPQPSNTAVYSAKEKVGENGADCGDIWHNPQYNSNLSVNLTSGFWANYWSFNWPYVRDDDTGLGWQEGAAMTWTWSHTVDRDHHYSGTLCTRATVFGFFYCP
jgi:hypothetical protein